MEVLAEVAPGAVFEDEVELVLCLEGEIELYDKGVASDGEYVALRHGIACQVVAHYLRLR